MGQVLAGLVPVNCMDYIDDILVIGKTYEEHLHNMRAVLERLRSASLKLKPVKCLIARKEVSYLGYTDRPPEDESCQGVSYTHNHEAT